MMRGRGRAAAPQGTETLAGVRPGDWALFGYDIGGTRFNAHEKTIGPDNAERLKVKWTFEGAKDVSQTTPIVVAGSLYFAAHDGLVYALDAQTGSLKWKFDAWEGIEPDGIPLKRPEVRANMFRDMRGSAAYADGRIYIGDGTARFHCLDAATGRSIWRTVLDPRAGLNQSLISASPVIYGGKIFIGLSTTAGRSYAACLDQKTGAIRWRFDTVPDPQAAGGGSIRTAATLDAEHGNV
ncbi:MAG: PQQ-binding-like beta-propeller repeat protein, partial [Acidobacteria bacterium]|nr:PQQ-binding-like beta-propeller repeat protein [Acidobacteriota bacterium]